MKLLLYRASVGKRMARARFYTAKSAKVAPIYPGPNLEPYTPAFVPWAALVLGVLSLSLGRVLLR